MKILMIMQKISLGLKPRSLKRNFGMLKMRSLETVSLKPRTLVRGETVSRIFIICILALLTIPMITAFSNEELVANLEDVKGDIIGQELSGPLGLLFGDEQVNIIIQMESGNEVTIGVSTKSNKVAAINLASVESPSLNIYVEEATLMKIRGSSNPTLEFKKALAEKKITYEALGFMNKIKFRVVSLFVNIYQSEPQKTSLVQKEEEIVTSKPLALEEAVVEEVEQEFAEEEADVEEEIIEETIEEPVEEIVEEGPKVHTVKLTPTGFVPEELTVNKGDTVEWQNVRTGSIRKAMIVGTRSCSEIKSSIFNSGDSFSWTFEETEKCVVVDGVINTLTGAVVVE